MNTAKQSLWLFFIALILFSTKVRGEGDAYNQIAQQGPINFSQGGAAFIPNSILGPVKAGQLSPIMQFILINSMMTKCVKNVLAAVPARRDPFTVANTRFATGYCKIRKCFEQGMLLGMLSQLSTGGRYSESADETDRRGSQMMAMTLAQSFRKEEACGGSASSGGVSIDPALIALIGN